MTASTHYALALLPTVQIEWFPMTGGLIALYTAFGVRLATLAIPRRPRRSARRQSAGRAAFWLGAAILILAAVLLTAAIARSVTGPA